MYRFKRSPSPATIISIVALVFAMAPLAGAATRAVGITAGSRHAAVADYALKAQFAYAARFARSTAFAHMATRAQAANVADNATNAGHAALADNATNAANSANAVNAVNATNAANAVRAASSASTDSVKTWFATASIGQTVPLFTYGPFTITGQCTSGPAAQTYVTTSQDGSALDSYAQTNVTPFNVASGAARIGYGTSGSSAQWDGPNDGSDAFVAADGHSYVNTFVSTGVKLLGHDCTFAGHAAARTQ